MVVVSVCMHMVSCVCEHVCMMPTLVDSPKDSASYWSTEKDRKFLIIFWQTVIKY